MEKHFNNMVKFRKLKAKKRKVKKEKSVASWCKVDTRR